MYEVIVFPIVLICIVLMFIDVLKCTGIFWKYCINNFNTDV